MKIEVSAQTEEKVRQLAKEIYGMLIPCYTFNGTQLRCAPGIQLRDTILERFVDPGNLVRVQLRYPDDGPDDRWYASTEALLGGGIEHNGKSYRILGASSSIKKGNIWMATDEVRELIHQYFKTSQEALSYLGILFSGCHSGIHQLKGTKGRVVEDGEFDTEDGQGFISSILLNKLDLPQRQLQVRLVSEPTDQAWLVKGTLLPAKLPDNLDMVIPRSMIKGKGAPPADQAWSFWLGTRDVARTREYATSFTFAQWFNHDALDAVWPTAEKKLDIIKNALTSREKALSFLGLINGEDELGDTRTKAEAFLEAGVGPDHKWLRRQLIQLMRREYVRLATGGGFELKGRMGAFATLPDEVICAVDLPDGPVVLTRYPIRDPHSIIPVWNERKAVEGALPGTIYMNSNTAKVLDGDFDGDYYVTCSQEPVVETVTSTSWYPDYHRSDTPPKTRLKDPLTALPFAAVKAIGNCIGTLSYGISGAVHNGKLDKVADLSAGLQSEVQSLKWDTRADRTLLNDPDLQIPEYIANSKHDKKVFVQYADIIPGDFPLIRNYNRIVPRWQEDTSKTTPLVHFKPMVPIWLEPAALDYVEEVKAVTLAYNSWIASILEQNPDPDDEDLAGPLRFLESWDKSKTENRSAWAVALWHVVHGSRAKTTGSAAFHAFSQEMVDLMREQLSIKQGIHVPQRKVNREIKWLQEAVIPLVGAIHDCDDTGKLRKSLEEITSEIEVYTKPNGGPNASFWNDELYLGQVPRDHLLYGSVPTALSFKARVQMRGKTVFIIPTKSDWLTAVMN